MSEEQKVAVITGGASGIGLALAEACLMNNMHVVIADIATHNISTTLGSLSAFSNKVQSILCDVSIISDVKKLADQVFEQFGRVDLLINNAGISGRLAPFWELTLEEIHRVIAINLFGVINGTHAFLARMTAQEQRGHIVNMASVYALCSGSYMGPYAVSKHGVLAFSESMYFELQQHNVPIDISVVCPSFTNTNLIAHSLEKDPSQLGQIVAQLMERSRPVEEVANFIMREIEKKTFYILPDKEVKAYAEQRINAISAESTPSEHSLEKLIASLSKRAMKHSK
jgi:NAD(P)-dependent dehydrogenase (short-subunit alcohol dehydrogenase family)